MEKPPNEIAKLDNTTSNNVLNFTSNNSRKSRNSKQRKLRSFFGPKNVIEDVRGGGEELGSFGNVKWEQTQLGRLKAGFYEDRKTRATLRIQILALSQSLVLQMDRSVKTNCDARIPQEFTWNKTREKATEAQVLGGRGMPSDCVSLLQATVNTAGAKH